MENHMANKSLFQSSRLPVAPAADCVNSAGGVAYQFEAQHALAQYATTGCLNDTFYASGLDQLESVFYLCNKVEPTFIAKTALYARQFGFMKDLPALLLAILAVRDSTLMVAIFDRVVDNAKMLRNFVQIIRSGKVGRKSFGTRPRRMIREWLAKRSDEQIFMGSVGNDPSLAQIIKMTHPNPETTSREALYGYLIDKKYNAEALPALVQEFEAYKKRSGPVPTPKVPFELLTALELTSEDWKEIARNAPWHMTRMNLNTFQRHGVFTDKALINQIAARLRNPDEISRAKVFPYQLLVAFINVAEEIPSSIKEALQDAMEIATANVPKIEGQVYIFPDVSGSMRSALTGERTGATTKVRCVDVAALVSSAILRINPSAVVIPFEQDVVPTLGLNPRDSVMTNSAKLASIGGGGTNCSSPLALLNRNGAIGDLIVYVSDNESWLDSNYTATRTMSEWVAFKKRNPKAKMVCIDIAPNKSSQAKESRDIINVGGFSDQVFNLIAAVANGEATAGYWVKKIESLEL
jgi:60 kDa SS-A/Ro ribonucleoprotein